MSDLTITQGNPRRRARERGWLELILILSALVHALILAIIILARLPPLKLPAAPAEPGFTVVWDHGQRRPDAVPNPGRAISIPRGENTHADIAHPQSAPQKPVPVQPAPELNPLPPETLRPEPPRPLVANPDAARPLPRTARQAHREQKRPQTAPKANPFAHPMDLNFASIARPMPQHGLRGSRSLDLSMGLRIEGGQLREAVPHVSSPGANGDYLELLSEYVETHKFYPEHAAANGEDGVAVIKATIRRDGTVQEVHLVESSGSRDLDLAWLGLFRTKRLAPFPDDMPEKVKDFTLSMDYELIYR